MSKTNNKLPPVHPGEILSEDLMQPLGIETPDLARALKIPAARLRDIITGRRAIDTNVALRLARYFDSTAEFWLNLFDGAFSLRGITKRCQATALQDLSPAKTD